MEPVAVKMRAEAPATHRISTAPHSPSSWRTEPGSDRSLMSKSKNTVTEAKSELPLSGLAHQAMRDLILSNRWPPGYQATEQEIATQLDMSRTPVREAMMRLQQDGLVSVVPRHGLRVLPVSAEDMDEIYTILTSLEATAAELAATRNLSTDDISELEASTEAMDKALSVDDLDTWAEADARFHEKLLDLCGNRKLKAVVLNFMDRAHRARMTTLRLRPKPLASTQDHIALVDAIRRGDPVAAGRIHREHRERAGKELLALLHRIGLKQL